MINLLNISKAYGTKDLFSGVSLRIDAGDRIGMIGANGTGKSTIARIIMGTELPDNGEVQRTKSWRLGYLAQEVGSLQDQTLHNYVEGGRKDLVEARIKLEELEKKVHEQHDEETQLAYADALHRFEEVGGYSAEAEVDRILHGLGFDPDDSDRMLKTLSGGWIMRAALARLLFREPEMLILDEPTNHLDLPALAWLEEFLSDWKGAFLVISHDRTFLNNMVTSIVELANDTLTEYRGNYDAFVEQKEQREEILEATRKNQEQKLAQVERFIEKNRAKKHKARQVGSRKKMLELLEKQKVELPKKQKRVRFSFPQPERSGTPVIRLSHIDKSYGDLQVYKDMHFEVRRGEKVALVGPNGAGKSTLLKLCAGSTDFQSGDRTLGHNVRFHYFAQHQLEALNPDWTPLQEMTALPGWDKISWLRSLMGAMLLGEKEIETTISDLSGGEKAKLALAKMLVNPANFIMMDEPTNHLDPQAREILEEALKEYSGSLLFISHDRTFINAIATRVVEVKHGRLAGYIGNYDDYLRAREKGDKGMPVATVDTAPRAARADAEQHDKPRGESRHEEKERKKREAQLRAEKKKATEAIQRQIKELEEKISATENKLEDIHAEYSKTDLPPERFAELGKESQAVSAYLKKLYEDWEAASLELEQVEEQFAAE